MLRRIGTTALVAVLLVTIVPAPASAAKPIASSEPTAAATEPAASVEHLSASDRKVAAAAAYLDGVASDGGSLATLACVTATSLGRPSGGGSPNAEACGLPQGFLPVEARDQVLGTYCGPAVGQVIANYAWAAAPGRDRFSQRQIAVWMRTDVAGATSAQDLVDGLDAATRGAPRRPAGWEWAATPLEDADGDGHVGDELQGFVRANVSGSRMPLAFAVKPHAFGATYRLSSWTYPVDSVGHWITVYGWVGDYSNTDELARIYYTDSSEDEGGGTGKFWDPTFRIAEMIRAHTGVIVW